MKTLLILASLVFPLGYATAAHAVTFDWAQIGNAGNAGDVQSQGTFGAVAYNYAISKTEVTNIQYVEFLNSVAATDPYSLYNTSMASSTRAGITRTGSPGSYSYAVKVDAAGAGPGGADYTYADKPVVYVSWFDSVRFINWLHNGQGTGDTEAGAYTLLGSTATPSNGLSVTRKPDASYWLPSEDEWYKAAYHDASAGTAGTYFDYATGSDSIPVSDQPGDDPTAVNYFNNDGLANGFNDGYAVSGSPSFSSSTNPFTDVGAYAGAESPYGTYDQNGNVWEWNEATRFLSSSRGLRGGSWPSFSDILAASFQFRNFASVESFYVGFRVATVAIPEPTSLLLFLSLTSGMLLQRRR